MALQRTRGSFKLRQNVAKFEQFKQNAPLIVANMAMNHFLEGFRKGGFMTDASSSGWQRRKKEDKGRAILVKSGDLRDSIHKKVVNFNAIVIATKQVPYARRHNEGLKKMPKREFMGKSKKLNAKITRKLYALVKKVMT